MRGWTAALLLCAVSAMHAAASDTSVTSDTSGPWRRRAPRSLASAGDYWRNLMAEYVRGAGGAGYLPPIPVQVPLQGDNSGRESVSLLVVPVPVPVPVPAPAARAQPAQSTLTDNGAPLSNLAPPTLPGYNGPFGPVFNTGYKTPPYGEIPAFNQHPTRNEIPSHNPQPALQPSATRRPAPSAARPARPAANERFAREAPNFPPVENSRLLVEQFRAQVPEDPRLPPIVIDPVSAVSTDDHTVDELRDAGLVCPAPYEPQAEIAAGDTPTLERRRMKCMRRRHSETGEAECTPEQERVVPPPHPRFESSLFLRARLTVPRADYTEPYSMWWDAATGASRVDFHGGATSTYRMVRRDGRVQSAQIRIDRTAEKDVRRCVISPPRHVTLAERALPALPDLQAFYFAGYAVHGDKRAERWLYTLSGHSGELGAARGESLTFRHELLVSRSADNYTTTPHWYSVRVDSSVLGADCDGYVHHFDEVRTGPHDSPMIFHLDIADACEHVERTDRMETVEPLREFTMLCRDPRHDAAVEEYKQTFSRTYADDVEEAVRKNVFIQSSRHVESGNRQGASFEMQNNFLSDRLKVERRVMGGVAPSDSAEFGDSFPHSRAELNATRGRLPNEFDWRKLGGVTPVRSQGTCQSCWAFATVAAVEGALFKTTDRLVALSEQVLVDCSQEYGGHGCKPTWPSAAYRYIRHRGLPALDDYVFVEQEQQCRAESVPTVTRISGYFNVTQKNILAVKVAIKKYGPTVLIIDIHVPSFESYSRGYYHDARCKKNSSAHAVVAVGWTLHKGETYFIIKNSWSRAWGEEGYMRIRAPTNTCGLLRLPSVPRLGREDVLRVPSSAPAGAPTA